MESIWTNTQKAPTFEPLKHSIKTDVLIIGGGICGLLCAHMLNEAGVACVVAEADRIGWGITKNTTAKITAQHGAIYDKIIRRYGSDAARMYYESQREAVGQYRALCRSIDCDFEEKDSFVYSLSDRKKMERETDALHRIGCSAEFVTDLSLPFPVAGAVRMTGQAQFHPLKFLYAIADHLPVYENTRVLEILPDGASTSYGKITADHIVVATHFPFINKHGFYFIKMYQDRSYVIGLKNGPDVGGMYVDEAEKGMSFRNYKGNLLLSGGGHRTGKKGGGWAELTAFAQRYYPHSEQTYRWATQDCRTLDDMPYIGQYSRRTQNVYVATGFNKWGMSTSMTSAMLLRDRILGRDNPYKSLYYPARGMLHPRLGANLAEALIGMLTPTVPRCPHLGCALKYNKQEHSWDCSCHGSRFTEDGKLIDNPATGDKKL